jgi:hypothetical protein
MTTREARWYTSPINLGNHAVAARKALADGKWKIDGQASAGRDDMYDLIVDHGSLANAKRASLAETTGTGWIKCGEFRARYQA